MRTIRTGLAATALATTAVLGLAPAASAAEAAPTSGEVVGVVVAKGDAATLTARYRCSGGGSAHLWVSVKQGTGIAMPDHTSSRDADAWYDTNYLHDENGEPALTVPCDGRFHGQRFTLKRVFGELHDGPAFVQFCMYPFNGSAPSSYGEMHDVRS